MPLSLVGARRDAGAGRASVGTEPEGVATHCPHCDLQCAVLLTGTSSEDLTVTPRRFPTNRGGLCQRGWASAEQLRTPGRLTTPLVRVDGELRPASWDSALAVVADGIERTRAAYGPDGVAVHGGRQLTNENAYQLTKFAEVAIGTSRIDVDGSWSKTSAAAAATSCFGNDRALPFPVTDVGSAHAVLLVGADPAETMSPFLAHLVGSAAHAGLMVVDPRVTTSVSWALLGDGVHLRLRPRTDAALALGLIHLAVTENFADQRYIASRTSGFDDFWPSAAPWTPDRVERTTGVSAMTMRTVLERLCRARDTERGAFILNALGAGRDASEVDAVTAFIALALVLGLPGEPGSGFGTIIGQSSGSDDAAVELLDRVGAEGGPRSLLVDRSNLAATLLDSTTITERLASLDLLVVSEVALTETASMADVVLPVLQWAEEEGTLTTFEGRMLRRRRALSAPPGCRSGLEIWADLAARIGTPVSFAVDPQEVFDELRQSPARGPGDCSAVTWERLDADAALHLPCSAAHPQGTPRLFLERFATPDGRAHFAPLLS